MLIKRNLLVASHVRKFLVKMDNCINSIVLVRALEYFKNSP